MTSNKLLLLHYLFLLLCAFSLLACICAGDIINCLPDQRASLLRLKRHFSFPEGDSLVSWMPGSNCCSWVGVTCDPESSHIIKLELNGCDITGGLHKDFFTLKYLKVLDLSVNTGISGALPDFPKNGALESLLLTNTNLSGSIPDSIGNLRSLTDFEISGCGAMAGVIPASIGNLTRLITLDLSGNKFTGVIPSLIGNLSRLSYLDLSANNLNGVIPASIGNLVKLVHLDLSSNNLTGVIPTSTGNLTHLNYMNLVDNSLYGPIPASLFGLPALVRMYLSDNKLNGELEEFSNLSPSLGLIDLTNNQLHGQIPRSLFELPSLQMLYITSNNFNGTVELDMVAQMGNLTTLELSHNKLWIREANNDYFQKFPILDSLGLAHCNLTKVPAFLRYQNRITWVDLSDNAITGEIPKWIWTLGFVVDLNLSSNLFTRMEGPVNLSLSSISSLDLHSNMLQGPIPLPPLSINYLDYSNNNFSSEIPPNISLYVSNAAFVSLANNSLTGEIPPSICNGTYFLTVLDLSENSLSGSIPPCIFKNRTSLGVVKLKGNRLQGTIPSNINSGCQLKAIFLSDNHLKGPLPRSLVNCSALEVLDLGNNQIAEPFPIWLGNIANLSVLILSENAFYGPVGSLERHEGNNTFSNLQIFNLSSNNFKGALPSKFFNNLKSMMNSSTMASRDVSGMTSVDFGVTLGNPVAFDYGYILSVVSKGNEFTLGRILNILYTAVDFSNNGFEGEIPEVIGKLQGLHMLNLSHNVLTGKIPSAIGNMKQLEFLDLSANHLSGEIPKELTFLTFLAFLNLSNNDLSGKIPQGNQFLTFTNSSFDANQGLCGSPLSKQCESPSPSSEGGMPPSDPDSSSSTYVIGLALFTGLGYGFGIALFFLLQNMSWNFLKFWKRPHAIRHVELQEIHEN